MNCTLAAPGSARAICIGLNSMLRNLLPAPFIRARRSTARETASATFRMAIWNGSGARTVKSNCAVSALSWARSKRLFPEYPAVRRVLAQIREVQPGNPQLVAYVVAGASQPSIEALREHLASRLPAHAIPSAFVFLDAMPQLPNGKTDVRRLPAPDATPEAKSGPLAPRTPVEEVVAGIWVQVLQREHVGVRDDFFALGGHSLLAAKLVSRIALALGVELPLRSIFERPTVEGLAALIEQLARRSLRFADSADR